MGVAQHGRVYYTLQLLSESLLICPFSSGMSDSVETCAWPVVWKLLMVVQNLNEVEQQRSLPQGYVTHSPETYQLHSVLQVRGLRCWKEHALNESFNFSVVKHELRRLARN